MRIVIIPSALAALALTSMSATAFAPSSSIKNVQHEHLLHRPSSSSLHMSTQASTTRTPLKPKKTVADRSQAETISLIQDIFKAAIEAGPRAGPARTIQAYRAFTRTIQDFMPQASGNAEEFSAPVALRKIFERMGATYVKLGQFIASSPTLFPAEYVVEFQKCLDSTEALEWNVIRKVIEKELGGKSINSVFEFIDEKPLASASIAQVHAGKLKTGEDIVIKVQKPSIDESLKADLSFIYIASRVLEFIQVSA